MIILKPRYIEPISLNWVKKGKTGPSDPPSPARTRSPLEQSLETRQVLEMLNAVVSEPHLENSGDGYWCFFQWKNNSFYRCCKDRLCVMALNSL
jgi:hypothetical protein